MSNYFNRVTTGFFYALGNKDFLLCDDAIEFFCLAGDSKESAVAAAYYAGFADGRRSIRRKKRKKAISSSSAEPETQDSCAE